MNTNLKFLFTGSIGVALLVCSCARENNSIVINPPSALAAAAPVAPTLAVSIAGLAFHNGLAVVRVDSEETGGENGKGANVLDGNPDTIWHTQWQDATPECPHEIVLQLEATSTLKGFTYLPRQGENDHGDIKGYEFYTSADGQNFGTPVAKGEFAAGKELKTVSFELRSCRFVKLKALSEINGEAWTSAAEIGVVKK